MSRLEWFLVANLVLTAAMLAHQVADAAWLRRRRCDILRRLSVKQTFVNNIRDLERPGGSG